MNKEKHGLASDLLSSVDLSGKKLVRINVTIQRLISSFAMDKRSQNTINIYVTIFPLLLVLVY